MNFKESYLVPKAIYEKMTGGSPDTANKMPDKEDNIPGDVRMRLFDYNNKFPKTYPQSKIFSPANPRITFLEKTLDDADELVSSIRNTSRKNLAKEIVTFIDRRGGGVIGWTKNFDLVLDNQRQNGSDIRDILAYTVGEIEDFGQRALPFISKLKEVDAPPYFFMFYNKNPYLGEAGGGKKLGGADYWPRDPDNPRWDIESEEEKLDSPQAEWDLQAGQEKDMSSDEEVVFSPKLEDKSPPSPKRGRSLTRTPYTLRQQPRQRRWKGDNWEIWKEK